LVASPLVCAAAEDAAHKAAPAPPACLGLLSPPAGGRQQRRGCRPAGHCPLPSLPVPRSVPQDPTLGYPSCPQRAKTLTSMRGVACGGGARGGIAQHPSHLRIGFVLRARPCWSWGPWVPLQCLRGGHVVPLQRSPGLSHRAPVVVPFSSRCRRLRHVLVCGPRLGRHCKSRCVCAVRPSAVRLLRAVNRCAPRSSQVCFCVPCLASWCVHVHRAPSAVFSN
jgi:hypothetical protein